MSASRAGRKAEPDFLGFLHRDQSLDDLAALDQERVHRLIDAVDFAAQIGERNVLLGAAVLTWHRPGNGPD